MDKLLRTYNQEFYDNQANNLKTDELVNEYVKKFGRDIWQQARQWSAEFEAKYLEGIKRNPELIEWIKSHKNQYQMFLWTSNCLTTVKPILTQEGLVDCFDLLVTKDIVMYTKPDPDGFTHILDQLRKKGSEHTLSDFLFIGDSDADRGAAEAVGIDFFRIKYF